MSIPAPTYTYKGLSYEVEEDLYLGLKYNNIGSNNLKITVGATKKLNFQYGAFGAYANSGEQFGNEGFSYQVGNNDPVFVPRNQVFTYYTYYTFDYGDERIGPTSYEITIPASETPDTGEVDIKVWSSDESHKPSTRLTQVKLTSSTRLNSVTESKIPVTEDLIELDIRGAIEAPDLQRARKLQLVNYSNVTNTELNFKGLTKLRKVNLISCDNVTSVECEDLDECVRVGISSNNSLEFVNLSGCFNLQTLSVTANPLLTSVRCVDLFSRKYYIPYPGYYQGNFSIANNASLGAAALNQIYTDLADTTSPRPTNVDTPSWINPYTDQSSGFINVVNNLGATSDDPTIATAKGWIVNGT